MRVTGYRIQHTLREAAHTRDILASQFTPGLWQFEGSRDPTPPEVMTRFQECENKIAILQTAQSRYNLTQIVSVLGQSMTLQEAVKRVGGAGRMEKIWRSLAKDSGRDRYSMRETSRKNDESYAGRTVTVTFCIERAQEAAKYASALRQAIATANAVEIEIDVSVSLFE